MRLCNGLLGYVTYAIAFHCSGLGFRPPLSLDTCNSVSAFGSGLNRCGPLNPNGVLGNSQLRQARDGYRARTCPHRGYTANARSGSSSDDNGNDAARSKAFRTQNLHGKVSIPFEKHMNAAEAQNLTSIKSNINKDSRSNGNVERHGDIPITAASIVHQSAAVAIGALTNSDAAHALLLPVHDWSISQKRVADAVEAEKKSAHAAAERKSGAGRQSEHATLQSVLLMQPTRVYNAIISATTLPGQVAENVGKAVERLSAMPEKVRRLVDDVVDAGEATAKSVALAPQRTKDALRAAQELPGRTEKALADGAEAFEASRAAVEQALEESRRVLGSGTKELARTSERVEAFPARCDGYTIRRYSMACGGRTESCFRCPPWLYFRRVVSNVMEFVGGQEFNVMVFVTGFLSFRRGVACERFSLLHRLAS